MASNSGTPSKRAREVAAEYLSMKLGDRRGVGQELRSVRDQDPVIWDEIVDELAIELDAFAPDEART